MRGFWGRYREGTVMTWGELHWGDHARDVGFKFFMLKSSLRKPAFMVFFVAIAR